MKIRDFCLQYNNYATESLKEDFLKDNLEIKSYLPFLRKDAIATVLAERTTYKHEPYAKEDGTIGQKKTDVIRVNSTAQYLLFCRVVIENYTNLEVETDGFFEEYDLLKQSGLLDKLMVGNEQTASLIPADEIGELRQLLSLKQSDIMTNFANPQTYIQNQVSRFGQLANVTLTPILNKLADKIEKMDDKDIEKFGNKIEKVLRRVNII